MPNRREASPKQDVVQSLFCVADEGSIGGDEKVHDQPLLDLGVGL